MWASREVKLIRLHKKYLKLDKNSEKVKETYRNLFQGFMLEFN